jgi:hypothetical protein
MPSQSVGARKPTAAAPVLAGLRAQFAAADEFLLARVQPFVALAIVLSCKSFAANSADEGAFVGVCAEVGPEIVRTSKLLFTQVTFECCGMFLDAAG